MPALAGGTPPGERTGLINREFGRVGRVVIHQSHVIVSDLAQRSIAVFTLAGEEVRSMTFAQGKSPGEFVSGPAWVAANDSMIACADLGTPRIVVFDTLLRHLWTFIASGSGVTGVAFDHEGGIVVPVWAGHESFLEFYSSRGVPARKLKIAESKEKPISTLFTLIPAPAGGYLLVFNFTNKVMVADRDGAVTHTFFIEGLESAADRGPDVENLKSNSIQCAVPDRIGGFWVLLGKLGAIPRQEAVYFTARGECTGRARLPLRTYFAALDRRGSLYLVPEERNSVLVFSPGTHSLSDKEGSHGRSSAPGSRWPHRTQ